MKQQIIFLIAFFCSGFCFAQNNTMPQQYSFAGNSSAVSVTNDSVAAGHLNLLSAPVANSPYKTSLIKDGLVITSAVGVTLLGYELIILRKGQNSE